jgi:uncharacterized protein YjbI with pentapeptide repeats
MDRCNELCTKNTTGYCAHCEARPDRDRAIWFWLKGELLVDRVRALKHGRVFACLRRYAWLMVRLRDRSKAPRRWWYPVPRAEIRHKDVVREAHKQYSETINKTMLALLGVVFFCLLTTVGSPDKLLLAADSIIKVPFADAPMSFLGFIIVAPSLLIVLAIYLHVFYDYWLACERERQYINQHLIPPIESIPTLFSFPEAVPRILTGLIFYWLVPLVLATITWKAWALPDMGRPLTYVSGVVTVVLVYLQIRRRPDNQRQWWTFLHCIIVILIIGLMVRATFNPQSFHRPLNLFRAALPKAWLAGINMRHVFAVLADLEAADLRGADLQGANLREAKLQGANLQGADLREANLQGADLQRANLERAKLQGVKLQRADLQGANLQGAKLQGANLERANLQGANLQGADLREAKLQANLQIYLHGDRREFANLQGADLQRANLERANLDGAILQRADLQGAYLQGAYLQEADLREAKLQGADLTAARLQRAGLQRANLERANLQAADLQRANFQGANLQGANLQAPLLEAYLQEADLQGANLQRAGLQRANLERANLQAANLERANLQGANLRKANLERANLEGADLERADLREANLWAAKLSQAKLQGTNVTGVKNLTHDQVNTACVDENTQLPEGLIRPAPCPAKPHIIFYLPQEQVTGNSESDTP